MLIGIPPLLGPDFLSVLRAMGHGDELALVDGNYPAVEHARRLVRADGHDLVAVLEAVLAVMPVDRDAAHPVMRAGWANSAGSDADIHRRIDAAVARALPGQGVTVLEGAAFYDRVRAAHCVVATSEPALYANVILRKGVIAPTAPPDVRPARRAGAGAAGP